MRIANVKYLTLITFGTILVFYVLFLALALLFSGISKDTCLSAGLFPVNDNFVCWDSTLVYLLLICTIFACSTHFLRISFLNRSKRIPFCFSGDRWYTILAILFNISGAFVLFILFEITQRLIIPDENPLVLYDAWGLVFVFAVTRFAVAPLRILKENGKSTDAHA